MKMKRMVASVLALLLVVSLLPMTALAEGTFDQTDGKIEEGQEFNYNEAQNVTNYGTVTNNTWGSEQSPLPVSIKDNYGTVVNNGGYVHQGTVVNNHADATVVNNKPTGIVVNNDGLVTNNTGTVNNNKSGGTVEINGGKIQTNNGTVGKKEDGQVVAGSGNNNAIDANCGTVISNNENGTVGTNTADGKIEINDGTVGNYHDDFKLVPNTGNYGTIGINNGTVTFNQNGATIGTNNGKVASNYGTVETNAIDGVVYNKDTFPGIASRSLDDEGAAAPEEKPNVDGVGTNFGTVYDKTKEGAKTTYYGLSWGDNVDNLNSIESFVQADTTLNLNDYAAKASRSGYEMTGYTAFARNNGTDEKITSDITNYLMKAPVWLKIMWKQIVTAVEPASNEPEVKTTTIPTSLSAGQVKVGAYVRRGNMTFRIIEVTDDAIRVATVGKLSEEDLADMLGCLKKHLSDAQIAKINGEPALLEQELVTYFFGDGYEHIAFRAARDLFA